MMKEYYSCYQNQLFYFLAGVFLNLIIINNQYFYLDAQIKILGE